MSWISDFAGKAENFLNAMDKGAASALTGNKIARKYSMKSDSNETTTDANSIHIDAEYIETPEIMSLKTSGSTSSLYSGNGNGIRTHTRTSSFDSVGSRSSKVEPKILEEERLIDYLNSKNDDWNQLSDSSTLIGDSSSTNEVNHEKLFKVNEVKIDALSKELATLNKRYTELTSEHKQLQKKAIGFHNQSTTNEKIIKELKARESDFLASISAKDSQIAAFKVQLEELNMTIKQKEGKNSELELLNQQLNELIERKNPEDNETVTCLEKEICSLKETLKEEREELRRVHESNNQQLQRLEDNQRSLIEELENCQRQLNEAKMQSSELEIDNSSLKKKLISLEQEYSEFKLKANKTLQDKEELIHVLNSSKLVNNELQQSGNSITVPDEHIRLLQEQSDALVAELTELRSKYDSVRALLEKTENETVPRQEYEIRTLKDELEQEKLTNQTLKADISQLSIESKTYQDDLNQIRSNLSTRIAERDDEIEKLRKQLVLKQKGPLLSSFNNNGDASNSNASSVEWEQRLKTLTENLIAKQSTVEQLSSINHSLKLQLERSEQRLRELASSSASNNDVSIGIYHSPSFTNLVKHRISNTTGSDSVPLIEDDPNDGNVARNVKRAYGAIDAFSIRLGSFLRIYPSARAAFLVYILVLHLWVAFILIYYEPEIHSTEFHSNL